MFHLQKDWTPVKGLPTEEEEAVHATSKHPTEDEGKGTLCSYPTLLAQMEDADKEEFFDDAAKSGF